VDDRAPCRCHLGAKGIDIGIGVGGKGDHVDTLRIRLPQPNDMVLVMALGRQPDHVIGIGNLRQPPGIEVKRLFGFQIGDGIADVADFGDAAHLFAS
jgi:hypothetical protein